MGYDVVVQQLEEVVLPELCHIVERPGDDDQRFAPGQRLAAVEFRHNVDVGAGELPDERIEVREDEPGQAEKLDVVQSVATLDLPDNPADVRFERLVDGHLDGPGDERIARIGASCPHDRLFEGVLERDADLVGAEIEKAERLHQPTDPVVAERLLIKLVVFPERGRPDVLEQLFSVPGVHLFEEETEVEQCVPDALADLVPRVILNLLVVVLLATEVLALVGREHRCVAAHNSIPMIETPLIGDDLDCRT